MKIIYKILSYASFIYFLEIFVLYVINKFVYAGIFDSFFLLLMMILFIIGILIRRKTIRNLIQKYNKTIFVINVLIVIIFPTIFIYNLPHYSYNKAAQYIGEIKQNEGAKSFKYSIKKATTIHGTNTRILSRSDYLIEAEVDDQYYFYYFNPYSAQIKENGLILTEEQIIECNKYYKSVY